MILTTKSKLVSLILIRSLTAHFVYASYKAEFRQQWTLSRNIYSSIGKSSSWKRLTKFDAHHMTYASGFWSVKSLNQSNFENEYKSSLDFWLEPSKALYMQSWFQVNMLNNMKKKASTIFGSVLPTRWNQVMWFLFSSIFKEKARKLLTCTKTQCT